MGSALLSQLGALGQTLQGPQIGRLQGQMQASQTQYQRMMAYLQMQRQMELMQSLVGHRSALEDEANRRIGSTDEYHQAIEGLRQQGLTQQATNEAERERQNRVIDALREAMLRNTQNNYNVPAPYEMTDAQGKKSYVAWDPRKHTWLPIQPPGQVGQPGNGETNQTLAAPGVTSPSGTGQPVQPTLQKIGARPPQENQQAVRAKEQLPAAIEADSILSSLPDSIRTTGPTAMDAWLMKNPMARGLLGAMGSGVSPDRQKQYQAAQQFSIASGHILNPRALTQNEFPRELEAYTPWQPAIDPGTVANKNAARATLMASLKAQIPGAPGVGGSPSGPAATAVKRPLSDAEKAMARSNPAFAQHISSQYGYTPDDWNQQ